MDEDIFMDFFPRGNVVEDLFAEVNLNLPEFYAEEDPLGGEVENDNFLEFENGEEEKYEYVELFKGEGSGKKEFQEVQFQEEEKKEGVVEFREVELQEEIKEKQENELEMLIVEENLAEEEVGEKCVDEDNAEHNFVEQNVVVHNVFKQNIVEQKIIEEIDLADDSDDDVIFVQKTVAGKRVVEEQVGGIRVLTDEEMIDAALVPKPPEQVLAEGFSIKVSRKDIQTLADYNWLNDNIINFYMNLIQQHINAISPKRQVYAFNSFFCNTLLKKNHKIAKRWTRKIDIFKYDLLIVPVHSEFHWSIGAVDFVRKSITYYDSLRWPNNPFLRKMANFVKYQSKEMNRVPLIMSEWNLHNTRVCPKQRNYRDCGPFSCMFAKYLCSNKKMDFNYRDMPLIRRKIVSEIINKTLKE